MDKKLLAMFRKLLALDTKALPDSISPDDFSKLLEDSAGKLFIKPEDFKNLQKTLSQKDVDLKKAQEEIEKVSKQSDEKKTDLEKKLEEMTKTISTLSETIKTLDTRQENDRLAKAFPDILPELLLGKSQEEIDKIVERQREINKKLYGDSQHFAPPDFSTESDVDEAIEKVKADRTINGESSAVSVLHLERQKDGLSNE